MDRPAACGRGDGCYYCETSGSGHSVLRTIKATKLFSTKGLQSANKISGG
ncbi:hypothetical protein BDA96_05G165300 [Sorghum bicolor]|uniref:Uncharacterized protein n=1 Tax=Sorghum bicolor TaxID=4558 RepID=A0A921QXP7_SORBI|nr:hypothetical protein BDA96_05G165300 [Sorghum bicolor]